MSHLPSRQPPSGYLPPHKQALHSSALPGLESRHQRGKRKKERWARLGKQGENPSASWAVTHQVSTIPPSAASLAPRTEGTGGHEEPLRHNHWDEMKAIIAWQ